MIGIGLYILLCAKQIKMEQYFGLIRVGKFNGDLKQALLKYSEELYIFIPPNTGCICYSIVSKSNGEKCYITVSERYLHFSKEKSNIAIIIQSPNKEENEKRIKDLESILRIKFESPNKTEISKQYQKRYPDLILLD